AEVADLEGLKAANGTTDGEATPTSGGAVARDDSMLVAQLRRELEEVRKAAEVAERTEMELHEQLEALEKDKVELEHLVEATTIKQTADQKLIAELQERTLKLSSRDTLKRVASQEQLRAESPDARRNSVDSDSSKMSKGSGGPGKREQIAGLKHIISRLEEEIRQWTSKCAMLEQENKLLQSDTEQLQVAVRRLEATIDERLGKEGGEGEVGGSDGERIKRIETENELMKTKIMEMEQKHARAVLDLNKEITELENLVESKIYREDDLERELERYKEKLARATRSSSKLSGESILVNGGTNGTIKAGKLFGPRPDISVITSSGELNRCELCESTGLVSRSGSESFICLHPPPTMSSSSAASGSTPSSPATSSPSVPEAGMSGLSLKDASSLSEKDKAEAARLKAEGNKEFQQNHFADAALKYGEAIAHNPFDATLYCNRAYMRMKIEQHGYAIDDANFKKTVQLDPKNAMAKTQLDATLVRRMEFEKAIEVGDEVSNVLRCREIIQQGGCEVDATYTGLYLPKDAEGKYTIDQAFMDSMIAAFKDGKNIHRRFAWEIILGSYDLLAKEESL
ncbi:hypothetical protein FRC06_008498, partial [Ceratobasidium sp. 370]